MLPQGLPQGAATGVGVLCHVFDGLPHGLLYALRRTQGADVGGEIQAGQCVVFGLVSGPVAAVVSFSHQIPPQRQTAQRTRPSKTRPSTPAVEHTVGPQNIVWFHGAPGVADGGLVILLAKVPGGASQLNAQGPGHRRFRLGGVGAGVVPPVPPPDAPSAFGVLPQQGRGQHQQQRGEPGREPVGRVIQLGGTVAEIEIAFVFIPYHTVHGVDGLIAQGQRGPAEEQIEQGR